MLVGGTSSPRRRWCGLNVEVVPLPPAAGRPKSAPAFAPLAHVSCTQVCQSVGCRLSRRRQIACVACCKDALTTPGDGTSISTASRGADLLALPQSPVAALLDPRPRQPR